MRLQQNIFCWIIWLLWLDLLAAALAGFIGCCFGWIYWLPLSLDLLAAFGWNYWLLSLDRH